MEKLDSICMLLIAIGENLKLSESGGIIPDHVISLLAKYQLGVNYE